jgi:hypothetical protein
MRLRHRERCIILLFLTIPLSAFAGREGIPQVVTYLSPVPGSLNNSTKTNVIIRSRRLLEASNRWRGTPISVSGTLSGEHVGALIISDDGETLTFEPFEPFSPSEEVNVSVTSAIRTMHGESLGPFRFSFRTSAFTAPAHVALPVTPLPVAMGPGNNDRFLKTRGDSLPASFPKRTVTVMNNPSPGGLFLASFKIAEASDHLYFVSLVPSDKQYLMILDNSAKPVFYRAMGSMSTDFKLQPNGYLTYNDNIDDAFYELDSNYVVINRFRAGNGYQTDLHDLIVLPNGHVLMLAHDQETVDMSAIVPGGNPYATVIGAVIQELDKNQKVIFQWRSFDHFKVTDATMENMTAATIDAVHPNTIELDFDGNLLLSSRHMDEITKIDRQTGAIIWRWGGKNNQFRYTNDSIGFSHQHSIRRTPTGTLLLFDNGNYRTNLASRVVEYSLDETSRTATLVWQFAHSPEVKSIAMGSAQRLPNGNTLVGWGTGSPAVTEVRPDKSVAFELQFPDSIVSYRAFRFPWKQIGSQATDVTPTRKVPATYVLAQNYPNPFNPTTLIQFELPSAGPVSLKVYDIRGRLITTLAEGIKHAGIYSVRFDGSRQSSGTYIYRLTTAQAVITRMMTLVK